MPSSRVIATGDPPGQVSENDIMIVPSKETKRIESRLQEASQFTILFFCTTHSDNVVVIVWND